MPIEEIKTVCFVGAGTMGCVNSLVSAISGYNTVLYDVAADNLNQVPERHQPLALIWEKQPQMPILSASPCLKDWI